MISANKWTHLGICFDLGHLFHGFENHQLAYAEFIKIHKKNLAAILLNVKEFHIHDSDGANDHLKLGRGTLDFKFLANIFLKSTQHPIILEVELQNYAKESQQQLMYLRSFLE